MIRWLLLVAPLAGMSGGCLLFCSEGQPCDRGQCLPGYTCVNDACFKAGVAERGEPCSTTAQCKDGVCSDVNCGWPCAGDDDCFGDAACQAGQCTCQPRCRAACTYPKNDECDLGLICQQDFEQQRGFCQEGQCGPADNETCTAPAYCMPVNGPGSGLCVTLCDILQQQACYQGTAPSGTRCCQAAEACVHVKELWGGPHHRDGVCMAGGELGVNASCNDLLQQYCSRGLFCDAIRGVCVRYCNFEDTDAQPTCGTGEQCNAFSSTLPYGWCR